jgi:hypothetical protein
MDQKKAHEGGEGERIRSTTKREQREDNANKRTKDLKDAEGEFN